MEAAHLTVAHTIAQGAFNAPPKSANALIEQHKSAAVEFHNAAQDVDDSEALRVLALLEQHHHRLADIVRSHTVPPPSPPAVVISDKKDEKTDATNPATDTITTVAKSEPARTSSTTNTTSTGSPVRQHRTTRDVSSSIAGNLATARGIPRQPGSARPRQMSPPGSAQTSRISQRAQSTSSAASASTSLPQPPTRTLSNPPSSAISEDSFQKFYSSFGGLVSKLTAPLAFAGLPLHPDAIDAPSSSKAVAPLSGRITATSDDPAISRLFSRAALRAVQDRQGPSGVQESFFVVPTSGGTMPYSSVLAAQDKSMSSRHQRISSTASDAQDHFVDALQTQQQRGGGTSSATIASSRPNAIIRKSSSGTTNATSGGTQKTLEELELENASLKQLTDKLSHRLYDWEKNAQNQSIALQQSIMSLTSQRIPTRATTKSDVTTTSREDKDMIALEEALERAQKDLERFGRENEKLKTVVLRYRERWEKLKEGARVRREREDKVGKAEEGKESKEEVVESGDGDDG